jgi:hypothetical protein
MRFFFSTGAVLLSVLAATAGGIEFDPEDEGMSPITARRVQEKLEQQRSAISSDAIPVTHDQSCAWGIRWLSTHLASASAPIYPLVHDNVLNKTNITSVYPQCHQAIRPRPDVALQEQRLRHRGRRNRSLASTPLLVGRRRCVGRHDRIQPVHRRCFLRGDSSRGPDRKLRPGQ